VLFIVWEGFLRQAKISTLVNSVETKLVYTIIICTVVGATLGFGLSYVIVITPLNTRFDDLKAELNEVNSRLLQIQTLSNKTIHTFTLHWDL